MDPTPTFFGGVTYTDPNASAWVTAYDGNGAPLASGQVSAASPNWTPQKPNGGGSYTTVAKIVLTQGATEQNQSFAYEAPTGSLISGVAFNHDTTNQNFTIKPSLYYP